MKNSHRQCIIACDTLGDLHQSNIKVLSVSVRKKPTFE